MLTPQYGFYRFTRIPVGLTNVSETFQKALDVIRASVRGQLSIVYLGDIVVLSKSPADHIEQVQRVLQVLCKARDTIKLKKYKFLAETIDGLSHVIRPFCLKIAEPTTDTVKNVNTLVDRPTIIPSWCCVV